MESPITIVLDKLEGVKPSGTEGRQWVACCPAHPDKSQSLGVAVNNQGSVLLRCYAGCETSEVVTAIGLELRDLFTVPEPPDNGVTVRRLAFEKRIPANFILGLGVTDFNEGNVREIRIPYYAADYDKNDLDATPLFIRCRSAMRAKEGSYYEKGTKPVPYGLWLIKGWAAAGKLRLILVEGETDCWALWYHGFAALGMPGADMGGKIEADHVNGFAEIVVWQEPGKAGATFAKKCVDRLRTVGFTGKVLVYATGKDAKDPSDIAKKQGDQFPAAFEEILKGAKEATGEVEPSGNMPWSVAEAGFESSPYPWGQFQMTDMGNSHRMQHLYGKDIIYVPKWESWLVWNGQRWVRDDLKSIDLMIRRAIEGIWIEAGTAPTEEAKEYALQHWKKCQSAVAIQAMKKTTEALVCKSSDDFNKHEHLLNATNGTIDLRTGELRPGCRDDMLTYSCTVAYDPEAKCPTWEAALDKIQPLDPNNIKAGGNEQLIQFLKVLCGYFATGEVKNQYFPIFQGEGSNGKSMIIKFLLKILGSDYSMMAPRNFLVDKSKQEHQTEIAQLFGKRLVVSSELKAGQKLDMAFVKSLTGEGRQRGRGMNQDFWEFDSNFKLLMLTNPMPDIVDCDYATQRRIALVPFKVRFWNPERGEKGPEETKIDPKLESKLMTELPGILRWIVEGAVEYYKNGLQFPTEVKTATTNYLNDQDILAQFLDECTVRNEYEWVAKDILFKAYTQWCENTNTRPVWNRTRFGMKMIEHGFKKEQWTPNKDRRIWKGVGIKSEDGQSYQDDNNSAKTQTDLDDL